MTLYCLTCFGIGRLWTYSFVPALGFLSHYGLLAGWRVAYSYYSFWSSFRILASGRSGNDMTTTYTLVKGAKTETRELGGDDGLAQRASQDHAACQIVRNASKRRLVVLEPRTTALKTFVR